MSLDTDAPRFDPDAFRERLRELMAAIGIPPKPDHGYAARGLDTAEKRLGVVLPAPLRVLYGLAGKHRALTHMHNRLLSPAKLFFVDGLLVFQRECQNVCTHAIREADLGQPDPPVKQRSQSGKHVYDDVFEHRDTGELTLYAGSARSGPVTAFIRRFGPFTGRRWHSARV